MSRGAGLIRHAVGASVEVQRLVTIALLVAAPLVAFGLASVRAWYLVILALALQVLVGVATWWLGETRVRLIDEERTEARGETLLALGDALDPVLLELARVATLNQPERRTQRSGLVFIVLTAATYLGDEGSRARASYFRHVSGPPRAMVHEKSLGRSTEAKARFEAGTVAGDTALSMIDAGDELFCDDVDEHPPPGWEPSQRGEYKTFISVSVRAGAEVFGMLTLDAVTLGSLTEEDVRLMRALGHLMGTIEVLTA